MASTDYYLDINGIKGECDAIGFEKQIQIDSWSFGAHQAGSAVQGSGLGTGKVSLQDFHFTVENGSASPQLFLSCCKGIHIPKATLCCRKSGGDGEPYTYLKVSFENLLISSYQCGGSGGSILPCDQISFNFTKITWEYYIQKPGGDVSLTNTVAYDIKKVSGSGA